MDFSSRKMRAGCIDIMQEKDLSDRKQEKVQLRKRILKERNALPYGQREIWDRQIFEELIKYDAADPCSVYLCYVNYQSEVKTKEFILWCLNSEKVVFVPKVSKIEPAEMEFYQITAWGELKAGYQGILEPEAWPERAFPRWLKGTERDGQITSAGSISGRMAEAGEKKMQVIRILLPGAVFDRDGNRIGYGGGFYDRWLAKWNHSGSADMAVLEKIGLAYGIQIVGTLPAERFDRKVDCVITEEGRNGC